MLRVEDVLEFWLDEVGPEGWYLASDALDQQVRDRFGAGWEDALKGDYSFWLTCPKGALAFIILTDQFPRNMFRGEGRAFSSDHLSLSAAKCAIGHRWDMRIAEPARQFFYLPLMHSENLYDQDRCVRLMLERMPVSGASNLVHARAHREVIRTFGRFPYRNEALSRRFTSSERDYISSGGYGSTVQMLQAG